jgi:thiol-disulfide isomerase/thioredoxin
MAFALAGWGAAVQGALAADVPRYQFKVGQELIYRNVDVPRESNDDAERSPGPKSESILNVARGNPDGGWRILFRQKTTYGGSQSFSREGYLDVAPDGRIAENPTLSVMANPTPLFPTLPPNAEAMAATWSSTVWLDETKRQFKAPAGPPAADATTWTFQEDSQSVFSPIYEMTSRFDYEFDLKQGLIRKIAGTYTQDWPKRGSGRTTKTGIELAEVRQLDSPELAALGAEMGRYFELSARYDHLVSQTQSDFARAGEILDNAEALLKDAEGQFKLPAVQAMLATKLEEHARSAKYTLDEAQRFGKLIDKPSQDWKTTDLDDHPRSLADYKGKVVLLDFWYRGCGWCIRAMPQLKQLAAEFPRDKVAVVGMNNDRDLDDARYVIDKMGLSYETLKNGQSDNGEGGIHKLYGVQGWPTLVVLDPQGVVRHIHMGYSPKLRDQLGRKIRQLLDDSAATKPN